MPLVDSWTFGLNHLLTILGFLMTATIAIVGFKSFDKWKREKLEGKRIDIALEALAIAYEAIFIFEGIRSPISYDIEWAEMTGVDNDKRQAVGPYYAILKRIEHNKAYFERIWILQPRFMAVFGKDTSAIFNKLHHARRSIRVSAEMLIGAIIDNEPIKDEKVLRQLRANIREGDKKYDKVGLNINEFIEEIEKHCLPMVVHHYA